MQRILAISLALVLTLTALADASPRPASGKMTLTIPASITEWDVIPLALHFAFLSDKDRKLDMSSFNFILLGEDGNEVVADAFVRLDFPNDTVLKGKEGELKLSLHFDPYIVGQVPAGKKYQLVCICKTPEGTIATSAWFTLTPRAK